METPHRLARSLRQNITQVQSPSIFVGKALNAYQKLSFAKAAIIPMHAQAYMSQIHEKPALLKIGTGLL
ncbi:hypothetical protein [Pseudomonas cedrina]|uniref:hypothetical protein n=1 Tax=Pseudomonas cedrina TaxID=651740 RepID=UPI002784B245|nr:hypothetical protein [Pseudomonas cedrina]MDQ0654647.1 hypothetical protein [Pseudomonas cedrina]